MKRSLIAVLSVLMIGSVILAACAPAGTSTAAPTSVATEAPTAPPATEAPTAPPYDGMMVEAPDCEYGGILKSIEAVDALTVKFTLCEPDPAVPAKVAFISLGIQPSEYIEAQGGSGDLLTHPIGTGPYQIDTWDRGNQIVFSRFDDYWGEPAANASVVFRWGTESAQRLLELQSGTAACIDNVGPDDFATVEGDATLQLLPREALNVFYVAMTNTHPPFDNELVRQAFAQAIDRQRIVDNFYPEGSEVASHFTPCSIPNGCTGEEWYAFDVDAAKALLEQAGYNASNPFPAIKLYYRDVVRGYLPDPNVVATDIQAQLQENLGVDVEINVMESGAFIAASSAGELDGIHLLGWGADFPDIVNFLDAHFGPANSQFGTPFDDITENLAGGAQLSDADARTPFYEAANNAIKTHVPMIPVAHGGSAVACQAAVEGAHASPLGNESFAVMSLPGQDTFVWMQNAEPISLYCADETDGESLRACEQVVQALLSYEIGGTATETDGLAESYEASEDLTEWTFHLRPDVVFHDGSTLDANDVVMSYAVQWDASSPLHTGNTGVFDYWTYLFRDFMNKPAQ